MPDIEIREGVVLHEDGSATVTLFEPPDLGHERLEVVHLRRPRVKDLLDIDAHKIDACDYGEVAKLVSRLSGIPVSTIHEFDVGDFLTTVGAAKGLLKRSSRRAQRPAV